MNISEKKQVIKNIIDTSNADVVELIYDVVTVYKDQTTQDRLVMEAEEDIYNKRYKSVQEMRDLLASWDGK